MERMILCLWVLVCLGCGEAVAPSPTPTLVNMTMHELDEPEEAPATAEEEPVSAPIADPYGEHETWCEGLYKMSCECPGRDKMHCEEPKEPCPADRTGRAQLCSRPYWARKAGSFNYTCRPPWLSTPQQKVRRESQAVIIENLCTPPTWWSDLKRNHTDQDPDRYCWRLRAGSAALKECRSRHYCNPVKLAKLTAIVAGRESTWDNETTHESNYDIEANRNSYAKAKRKGWYAGSPHFHNVERWQVGYGWYGFNAALHVRLWDPMAPPEVLCRQVEGTETYLRKARGSFKKLWARYGDDVERTYTTDVGEVILVKGVTWYDIHRAASSGKLTPEEVIKTRKWSKKKKAWKPAGFVVRARGRKIKLDPFETVMWEMLGEAIPIDRQNEIAQEIRESIRLHFNPPVSNATGYASPSAG